MTAIAILFTAFYILDRVYSHYVAAVGKKDDMANLSAGITSRLDTVHSKWNEELEKTWQQLFELKKAFSQHVCEQSKKEPPPAEAN